MRRPRKEMLRGTGIFHKIWRGHNLGPVLAEDTDKMAYLQHLADTLTDELGHHVQWHSYCLMATHPHETGRVCRDDGGELDQSVDKLGHWMRNAHSRFAQQYNRRHDRRGAVACERPKTKQVDDEQGLLTVMFYGDANPVRAGMVRHPKSYRWSSYQFYAFGKHGGVTEHLTPPPAYLALGRSARERQRKYRERCDAYLRAAGLLDDAPEIDAESTDLKEADEVARRSSELAASAQPRAG